MRVAPPRAVVARVARDSTENDLVFARKRNKIEARHRKPRATRAGALRAWAPTAREQVIPQLLHLGG